MTTVTRVAGLCAAIGAAAAFAPPLEPLAYDGWSTVAVGAVAGLALSRAITGRRVTLRGARRSRDRLIPRAGVLTLESAQEESVWRALVLGTLVAPLGVLTALAVTTVLFSAAHAPEHGRRAAIHLLTGSVFGLIYLGTARLSAAVAAHAAYNVAVGITSSADPVSSVLDTRRGVPTVIRSPVLSDRPSTAAESPMPDQPPLAALLDVHKSFGSSRALAGMSIEIYPGEVVGLLGPNGAGKSTAVSLLLGLRRPDSGTVQLLGRDPDDVDARRRIGVVLQEVGFPSSLLVREIVELVRAHFSAPVDTPEVLEGAGLADYAGKQAGALSGGQRRRLAVALALAGRPDVLFLDEPTAGLDVRARRELFRELRTFVELGGAVLLTTQQLEEAEQLATRLVVLSRGTVLASGTVAEVRARSQRPRISLRADRLPPLPGTATVESVGDRHIVHVDDPDAFVAELVHSGVAYRDLEISRLSLEDAFLALTEDT